MINLSNENLPSGWEECGFKDISEVLMGQSPPSSTYNLEGNGLPFFQGKTEFQNLYPYVKKYCSSPIRLAEKNSILLSIRAPVGATNLAPEKCCIGRGIASFKPLGDISSEYLLYFFRSIEDFIAVSGNGTTFSAINKKYIEDIRFGIAPLEEQKRIIKRINEIFIELDEGITRLKKAKKDLKLYYQSLLKNAFEGNLTQKWREDNKQNIISFSEVYDLLQEQKQIDYKNNLTEWIDKYTLWLKNGKDGFKPIKPKKNSQIYEIDKEEIAQLPNLPSSWGYVRFGEIIESIDAGKSFKCDERPPNNSEVGVAKVSAISWGEYNQSESKTCTDSAKIKKSYFICEGDFIMSRANTIELVGAVVIVKKVSKNVMLSDKTLRISMKEIFKEFALYYLRSFIGRKEIMARSTGNQDSMRNIGQDRIKSICIPICCMEEIKELCNLLNKKTNIINEQIKNIDSQISKSESLRKSILKKAFSGRLVQQNPSEEPAKILIERIKNDKKKLIYKPLKSKNLKKNNSK